MVANKSRRIERAAVRDYVVDLVNQAVSTEVIRWDERQHAGALAVLFPGDFPMPPHVSFGPRMPERKIVTGALIPLLEFTWALGVIEWSDEQYADAMSFLFPELYEDEPDVESRKVEIKAERDRGRGDPINDHRLWRNLRSNDGSRELVGADKN